MLRKDELSILKDLYVEEERTGEIVIVGKINEVFCLEYTG